MKSAVTVLFLLRRMDCNDGVASYCETIISGLAARGDKVVIVSGPVTEFYGSAPRRAAITATAQEWIVLEGLSSKIPSIGVVRRLVAIMRDHKVDVISPQGLGLLPLTFVLSVLGKRPVVANYHPSKGGSSVASVATERSAWTIFLYQLLLSTFRTTRVIANSTEIYSFFHEVCGVNQRRLAHINNGVDFEIFSPPSVYEVENARRNLDISEETLVCLLSGRLNLVKGHDIAIDSVRILRSSNPSLKILCLFAGAGDQEAEIKSYAFQDDRDEATFRFVGFFAENSKLREIYIASDIILLPSRFEGFALAVSEAMGCGCVPIRTRSGGWQDQIVDGSNGFLIPFNDPQALADRILELSNSARRAAMREEAINFAQKNLGRDQMVEATSELYRSVVA